MLSLLFDSHFWYLLLIFGFVGVLIYLCFKYKQARLFVGVIAGLAVMVFTGYCAIELNYYYTASGGVFGFIGEKLSPNQATITGNYTFDVQNLMLTEDSEGTYSAKLILNDVVELDEEKTYGIYVNGVPATQVLQTAEFLQGEYRYQFYDDDAITLLCDDALKINIAFYEKHTTLKLSTEGKTNTLDGQSTVNYWNRYFNNNSISIDVKEFLFSSNDPGFAEVEGDTSNFNVVNYYLDGTLFDTRVYRQGQAVELPEVEVEGKLVTEWQYVNGDYYAYSYFAFPFEVEGNAIVKYLEEDRVVEIPDSYSLIGGKVASYGEDIAITTIKKGCFGENLRVITIGKNITTIEDGSFANCGALTRVYIDSPTIYSTLTSGMSCGGFLPITGEVYVLASVDDGTNAFLKNGTTATINGKDYNVYTATALDIQTTLEEVKTLIDEIPGQNFADVVSCKLYSFGKVVLQVKGYNSFEEEVVYKYTFTTVATEARTLTELWNARDGVVHIETID